MTARKRDESLLDVPLTISVLTAEDIDAKAIEDLRDIVDYTPGFYYGGPSGGSNDRSSRRLIMRGMQVNTDVQTRQGAMVFIDGAPVLGAEIGATENAARVETVKGPQAAYFGRSTFGGAINIITRNPSMDSWNAKLNVGAGSYNALDYGVQAEGPIIADKLAVRFNASSRSTDGHYVNAANGDRLGDRKTDDLALTLMAKPLENLTAKLRLHYWEDDDGPSASLGYGRTNGEDVFNCNLGGTALPIANGNNWVCGVPRFPNLNEINVDTTMTADFASILAGDPALCPGCGLLLGRNFLTKFGLRREAYEGTLVLDYEFANDWTLTSITATHSNKMARIEDLDRKATAQLGTAFDTKFLTHRDLSDFSQEIRLASSAQQRLKWLIGASYSDIEQLSLGVTRNNQGVWSSGISGTTLNKVETIGIFGSLTYDFTDRLNVSLEARRQDDKVTDGSRGFTRLDGGTVPAGQTLSGTFSSFTPRLIVDFKPTTNTTIYGIYAQGTRPGEFNAQLISPLINATVLACIGASIYAGIEIPEEELDNYELGVKGRFWDGRLTMTAAAYYAEWRKQHNRGQTICPDANGVTRTFQSTGLGGATDLQGVELEFEIAATDELRISGTYAYNKTDILSRDCSDCLVILGEREIAGLHKEFSRTPKVSGTLSAAYNHRVSDRASWFSRLDYVYTGSQYATEANIAETGTANRVNLRFGVSLDGGLRIEAYGTNIFNDRTFDGYQRFDDQAFRGFHMLTAGLPNKTTYGIRASYSFGIGDGR
ncbi:MAG: TonB-dependent receptor [Steroidobacteraceae bacterium]